MKADQAKALAGGEQNTSDNPVGCLFERTPWCPLSGCGGKVHPYLTRQSSDDRMTGLDHLICALCGHQGMRVPSGLHLLFRGPDEYVFQYPPSLATLTIAASPSVLAQFTQHSVTQIQAATFMADWVLLTGRANGTIRFAVESAVFEDCSAYFRRYIGREGRAQAT